MATMILLVIVPCFPSRPGCLRRRWTPPPLEFGIRGRNPRLYRHGTASGESPEEEIQSRPAGGSPNGDLRHTEEFGVGGAVGRCACARRGSTGVSAKPPRPTRSTGALAIGSDSTTDRGRAQPDPRDGVHVSKMRAVVRGCRARPDDPGHGPVLSLTRHENGKTWIIPPLVAPGAVDAQDLEAFEQAVRRKVLAIAARAVEERLNADRSDYDGPAAPCACGQTARYVGRPS